MTSNPYRYATTNGRRILLTAILISYLLPFEALLARPVPAPLLAIALSSTTLFGLFREQLATGLRHMATSPRLPSLVSRFEAAAASALATALTWRVVKAGGGLPGLIIVATLCIGYFQLKALVRQSSLSPAAKLHLALAILPSLSARFYVSGLESWRLVLAQPGELLAGGYLLALVVYLADLNQTPTDEDLS